MLKHMLIVAVVFSLVACAPTPSSTTGGNTDSAPGIEATQSDNEPIPTREGASASAGDSGSGTGASNTAPEGTGFTVEMDGAETLSITENGTINCENNVYVIRGSLDTFPQVSLILSQNASPGNFNLVNNPGDGSAASATVFFQDGRVFATSVNGIAIINELATAPGQPVSGSFDFSARSSAQTINVRGEFDFISGEDAVYCS